MNTLQITITVLLLAAVIYQLLHIDWSNNDLIQAFKLALGIIRKLLLITALIIVFVGYGHAQTRQYVKIEVTHFKADKLSSKLTKYEGGTIDIDSKIISIDKEAPKPQFYDIARVGSIEKEDEGYTSREYICITLTKSGGLKAVKIVAIYTPKNELCDLIVTNGKTHTDYCLTDK